MHGNRLTCVGYSTRPCRKWYSETAFSRRDVPFSARSSAISNISRRPRMGKIQWKALWIFMAGLLSRTAARCGMFFFEAVAVCRTVFTRNSLNTFIAVRYGALKSSIETQVHKCFVLVNFVKTASSVKPRAVLNREQC